MHAADELLLRVLRDTSCVQDLGLAEWDELLIAARATSLLGTIATRIRDDGFWCGVKPPARRHLSVALVFAARKHQEMHWEVDRLCRELADVESPIVLLKGAAYELAGLPCAAGRRSSDIDILVAADQLGHVERALLDNGWEVSLDDTDHVAYFRQWMHELPPFQHRQRGTLLDVHHTILPRTDTIPLNPQWLLDAAVPLQGCGRVKVLSPEDMVLHSAAHLFRNGDFRYGLRDLVDIHAMLLRFSAGDNFWHGLLQRARQLHLTSPCYWGVRYARQFLRTPVPDGACAELEQWRPPWPVVAAFDRLVSRASLPGSPAASTWPRTLAILVLSYYPPPRLRAIATRLFWRKRLPWRTPATTAATSPG